MRTSVPRPLPRTSSLLLLASVLPACFSPEPPQLTSDSDSDGPAATDTDTADDGASDGVDDGPVDETMTDTGVDPTGVATDDGGQPVCGDGTVDPDETCDDGVNDGSYGGCASDCQSIASHCGDGILDGDQGEACDDGDGDDGDGCNVDCSISGTPLWSLNYDVDAAPNSAATAVAITPTDDIVVTAYASGGPGIAATNVRGFTAEGDPVWTTPIVGGLDTIASAVAVSGRGQIAIGGYSDQLTSWVVGANANGNLTWEEGFDQPSRVADIAALPDGGFVEVRGDTSNLLFYPAFVDRYDASGNAVWSQMFDEPIAVASVVANPSGGFLVAGLLASGKLDDDDPLWLRRYDDRNQPVWTQTDPSHHGVGGLTVAADGTIYVSGHDDLTDELWLASLDSNGNEQWARTYVPEGNSAAYGSAVAPTSDGGVFVVGSRSIDSNWDILVRRYSAQGDLLWQEIAGGSNGNNGFQSGADCAVDSEGNLIVVGTVSTESGREAWLGKFAP